MASKGVTAMRQWWWLMGLSSVALLAGCGGDSAQSPTPANSEAAPITLGQSSAQGFANPTVASTTKVPAVPGLLQPTNVKARVSTISKGRQDPFATVPTSTIPVYIPVRRPTPSSSLARRSAPAPVAAAPQNVPPLTLTPLPPMASTGLTPLPSLPVPANSSAIPIPVPAMPASPTALAEAIEITGVMQVANSWKVIVKEPNSQTSRYVVPGDYLEGGRVLVKRIVDANTSEPRVILQQNGKEVVKTVGSFGPVASRF